MILPTGKQSNTHNEKSALAGFTLIELVLVMAILVVVLSMSGASLTSFFKGRSLEAEGKRFLALTRFAQNRAVSEGMPTCLWIDEKKKKYGLEISPGFAEADTKRNEFTLGRDLKIEVIMPAASAMSPRANNAGHDVTLRFQPEGFLPDTNPELIVIKEAKSEQNEDPNSVVITPSRNRFYYEISTNRTYTGKR